MQHFTDHPHPTSVSSHVNDLLVYFFSLAAVTVRFLPNVCQSNALKILLDVQWVIWFLHFCVIGNISLIGPSAGLSCSLMNAQRDELRGEVQM